MEPTCKLSTTPMKRPSFILAVFWWNSHHAVYMLSFYPLAFPLAWTDQVNLTLHWVKLHFNVHSNAYWMMCIFHTHSDTGPSARSTQSIIVRPRGLVEKLAWYAINSLVCANRITSLKKLSLSRLIVLIGAYQVTNSHAPCTSLNSKFTFSSGVV